MNPQQAEAYESLHVHAVYEAIAPHFSSTRHSPWPLVSRFLLAQTPGSLGLDVGCGNGKYLSVNPQVHLLGSDRSANLIRLARQNSLKPCNTNTNAISRSNCNAHLLLADSLSLPFRPASADFAISIAVIHHLSTQQRRRDAIAQLLRCVRQHGRVLLYAWALEQRNSRRGWDEASDQDALVPWVMRGISADAADTTYQRYYHLYREGELEDDVIAAGGCVLESGYERDNWWVICTPGQSLSTGV